MTIICGKTSVIKAMVTVVPLAFWTMSVLTSSVMVATAVAMGSVGMALIFMVKDFHLSKYHYLVTFHLDYGISIYHNRALCTVTCLLFRNNIVIVNSVENKFISMLAANLLVSG